VRRGSHVYRRSAGNGCASDGQRSRARIAADLEAKSRGVPFHTHDRQTARDDARNAHVMRRGQYRPPTSDFTGCRAHASETVPESSSRLFTSSSDGCHPTSRSRQALQRPVQPPESIQGIVGRPASRSRPSVPTHSAAPPVRTLPRGLSAAEGARCEAWRWERWASIILLRSLPALPGFHRSREGLK